MLRLLLAIALLVGSAFADGPFKELKFDDALALASKDGRIVMVDFFTTWCVPCKKLDQTTWKDPEVVAWLEAKSVALRLDAEKETELAQRYRITAYPTMILLKPDGTEIDRLVGYKAPNVFLSDVSDALAGRDVVARAKEKLRGHENDPMLRGSYADALAEKARYAEALSEYLWCFDNGVQADPSYSGVRVSFLLSDIGRLAKVYPEARDALVSRRDAAEARIVAGEISYDLMSDAIHLNSVIGEPARSLALFDKIKEACVATPSFREMVLLTLFDPLAKAKRHDDLLFLVNDASAYVKRQIRDLDHLSTLSAGEDPEMREALEAAASHQRRQVISRGCSVYEALLATGRKDVAATVADQLITFENKGMTYSSLIKAAGRAGDEAAVTALGERGLTSLPEKERGTVERAIKRNTSKK